jgi:hypothetical protein
MKETGWERDFLIPQTPEKNHREQLFIAGIST